MLIITTVIFFKYRVVNKVAVVHISLQESFDYTVSILNYVCF